MAALNLIETYASKATAVRGAKRKGLVEFEIEKADDGRWALLEYVADEVKKMAGVAMLHRSQFSGPVAYVHAFMDANPEMKRRDAIKTLVENGVASHTAATQINRWKHRNGLLGKA